MASSGRATPVADRSIRCRDLQLLRGTRRLLRSRRRHLLYDARVAAWSRGIHLLRDDGRRGAGCVAMRTRELLSLITAATLSSCGGRVNTVQYEDGPAPTSGTAGASAGRSGSGGNASGGRGATNGAGGASGKVLHDASTAVGGSTQTFPPGFPDANRTLKSLDQNEKRKLCLESSLTAALQKCRSEPLPRLRGAS